MPKRTDIHTILVPGSGPIVIGKAAEFDYSGTQAVKALRAQGYRVVLVRVRESVRAVALEPSVPSDS